MTVLGFLELMFLDFVVLSEQGGEIPYKIDGHKISKTKIQVILGHLICGGLSDDMG